MRFLLVLICSIFSVDVLADPGGYDPAMVSGGFDAAADARNRALQKEAENEAINNELRHDAPKALKNFSNLDLCIFYGKILRDEKLDQPFSFKEAPAMIIAEAKKRGIKVNRDLVKNSQIRIGMSQCNLYAALGIPEHENRTVGSWGVKIQHVYDGLYVYTDNGIVTSWQD
jgi:hypothetical protein